MHARRNYFSERALTDPRGLVLKSFDQRFCWLFPWRTGSCAFVEELIVGGARRCHNLDRVSLSGRRYQQQAKPTYSNGSNNRLATIHLRNLLNSGHLVSLENTCSHVTETRPKFDIRRCSNGALSTLT